MDYADESLTCVDCGSDFAFNAGDQHLYYDVLGRAKPKRCGDCRKERNPAAAAQEQAVRHELESRAAIKEQNDRINHKPVGAR
jgi:hypothetical protein